jgi:hypothetical protein
MKWNEMSGEVTFQRMPRSKPKTTAEGQEQLSHSLARMAAAPIASKRVPITEVGFGQCRFVVDDGSFPALCCGEPTLGGSWCAHHRALVFVRVAAPNHRKVAQDAPKGSADTPETVLNGPVKRQEPQPTKLGQNRLASANNQKPKPQSVEPLAQEGNTPAKPVKGIKSPQEAKKDGAGTAQREARDPKGGVKIPPRGEAKQAEAAAVKRGGQSVSAKQPEPARKGAAANPSAKKAEPTRKGAAAKPSTKKAEPPRKGSTAKPPAPAKKAAVGSKSSKRPAAAKKAPALRKGGAAKRPQPAKKAPAKGSSKPKASAKRARTAKRKGR